MAYRPSVIHSHPCALRPCARSHSTTRASSPVGRPAMVSLLQVRRATVGGSCRPPQCSCSSSQVASAMGVSGCVRVC